MEKSLGEYALVSRSSVMSDDELTKNGFEFSSRRICANGRSMDTSNIGQREPDNAEIEQPEETEASVTQSTEPSSDVQDTEERDAGDDEPTANTENDGSDIGEPGRYYRGLKMKMGLSPIQKSPTMLLMKSAMKMMAASRENLHEIIKDAPMRLIFQS